LGLEMSSRRIAMSARERDPRTRKETVLSSQSRGSCFPDAFDNNLSGA
jgi:hypothetical protein